MFEFVILIIAHYFVDWCSGLLGGVFVIACCVRWCDWFDLLGLVLYVACGLVVLLVGCCGGSLVAGVLV